MSNLTLKGIPEALHERLRAEAEGNRRSLNGEVIYRLERSLEAAPRSVPETLTLEEFIALPEDDLFRVELAAGRLVREPHPGFRHGSVTSRLARILYEVIGGRGRGEVFFDMGFQLSREPPTVRAPDLAFVSTERLEENATDEVFLAIAPDLAIEVLSPSNSASEIQRKTFEYLDKGATLVWIVDPETRTVTVYRARDDIRVLGAGDTLDGSAVVPGLEVEVDALFGRRRPNASGSRIPG